MFSKKLLGISLICSFLIGCSNLAFNERYSHVGWKKVIIAPFTGKLTEIAEDAFENALAVSPKLIVIPSSMTKLALSEQGLDDLYKTKPYQAMFELAKKTHADGIIFADIMVNLPNQDRMSNISVSSATINSKLIDAKSKAVVAYSRKESSSIFSSGSSLVQGVSQSALGEFDAFFDKLIKTP